MLPMKLASARPSAESPASKPPPRSMRIFVSTSRIAPALGALLCAAAFASGALARAPQLEGSGALPKGSSSQPERPAPRAHAAIIGGAAAQAGSFPSLAYVIDIKGAYAYQCSGTVVAPSLVLTAGHCAENTKTGARFKPSGYRVVTGAIDPLAPGATVSRVLGVIVYPGFARKLDEGDAALLVLANPVAAPPIALATASQMKRLKAGLEATMAGWGLTSFTQRLPTETLQSADTVVQGRRWCALNAPPFSAKGEICGIAPPSYATGACSGDSGGPLLAQLPGGSPIQIGIAVHVYGQCSTRRPSVFVKVSAIAAWIHTWIVAYRSSPASPNPVPAPLPPPAPTSPVPLS